MIEAEGVHGSAMRTPMPSVVSFHFNSSAGALSRIIAGSALASHIALKKPLSLLVLQDRVELLGAVPHEKARDVLVLMDPSCHPDDNIHPLMGPAPSLSSLVPAS